MVSGKRRAVRLAQREYLPMIGSIVMWGLVLTAIGHKDSLRLIAALTMMRSVQLFTRVPTRSALRQRFGAPLKIWRKSFKRARRVQLASMTAGIALIAAMLRSKLGNVPGGNRCTGS